MKVSDLARVYLEKLDSRPYVLCPEVVADSRVVSLRTQSTRSWPVVAEALRSVGYEITERRGVVKVCAAEDREESETGPYREFNSNTGYGTRHSNRTTGMVPDDGTAEARPRERVRGKIVLGKVPQVQDDELTALASCGSYVSSAAVAGTDAWFCAREKERRDASRKRRLMELDGARAAVEGRGQ